MLLGPDDVQDVALPRLKIWPMVRQEEQQVLFGLDGELPSLLRLRLLLLPQPQQIVERCGWPAVATARLARLGRRLPQARIGVDVLLDREDRIQQRLDLFAPVLELEAP